MSVVILTMLSPLLCVISVLVWLKLGAPVLFHQLRPGLNGKPFLIYKFRSMTDKTDRQGNLLPDRMRLSRFGRLLRASSMDELPELFNVIKGDMSLVGPRPLLMQYLDRYTEEQHRRHEVRPGITGWAQVNGRNELPWKERLALDVWYVDHWNFWIDFKIIVKTVKQVFKRTGIHQQGHVTMKEFMGNADE